MTGGRIGEILLEMGVITNEQLQKALAQQGESGGKLGDLLVKSGACTLAQITQALGEQAGLEVIDVGNVHVPSAVLEFVPREVAEEHNILPLDRFDSTLKVAIADPYDLATLDDLRFRLNTDIQTVLADPNSIKDAIVKNYGVRTDTDQFASQLEELQADEMTLKDHSLDLSSPDDSDEDAPVIRLVTSIIVEAIKNRASDIHIEPFEKRIRIRYRIDGVCHEVDKIKPPKRLQGSIISRIKIMARMQIEEKRKPQDGQIKINVMGRQLDLRVSVIPATWGESIVMRILEKEALVMSIADLGLSQNDYDKFQSLIKRPNGIFLVTGPTGSGKTTTLYGCLNELNRPDVKIITAEDPVEYHLTGINQAQVNHQIGFSFARILRAMLRQAPNIILVGEIRDKETAEMAIEAALTGHLVFSTLHTNDAPAAITRLIDMGVKAFLVASSIQGVMAQRLVRVICNNCKESYEPPDREIRSMGMTRQELAGRKLFRGKGCEACNQTGYKGRHALFELMVLNRKLREMAFRRASSKELRVGAIAEGMTTLRQDGIRLVLKGVTTMDEVDRETHAEIEGMLTEAESEADADTAAEMAAESAVESTD